MIESPSRYGGIAAVRVFGIGLLAVGKTLAGVGVLVFGAIAMAIALTPSASGRALFAAIGALVLGGVLGYQAASNEATFCLHIGRRRRGASKCKTSVMGNANGGTA